MIIDANQKALALFGYKNLELSSIKIPMLHPAEALEKSKWAFETIIREGSVTFESAFVNKNGDVIPAEVSSNMFLLEGRKVPNTPTGKPTRSSKKAR